MSIITVLSASYCHGEEVARETARQLGLDYVDSQVAEKAHELFGISAKKLLSAMHGSSSVIDKLSRGRGKNVAYLRAALAEVALQDNFVYYGEAGHLFPKDISHIMRVCLVADHGFRVTRAVETDKISEKEAVSLIKKNDSAQLNWTQYLFGLGPWDESLYDIVIPMHTTTVEEAVRLICENARSDIVQTTEKSRGAMEDFVLASKVNVMLAEKKHEVDVTAENGKVIVILKKYVMRLEHYKQELVKLVEAIPGVKKVEVRIGSTFRMPYAYPPVEFEVPKKVLLVDDEKEFVHTLSERLQTRHMEPSVVYDGEEALSFVSKDQPEVMVLDLKMPGIDGLQVLKKVKKDHPETEVIILTGHGSDRERELAMELGAFAYLEKPVDINVLTETMTKAYAKIRRGSGSTDDTE